jgi:insulysin
MAVRYFEGVENKSFELPDYSKEKTFTSEGLGSVYKIVPHQEVNILKMVWPRLPDKRPFWKHKPLHYLKHLFGNKGPNSLLSELIKQELASNIVCGSISRLL